MCRVTEDAALILFQFTFQVSDKIIVGENSRFGVQLLPAVFDPSIFINHMV